MTLTEIRNAVIARMTAQTAIAAGDVRYPNDKTYDPKGKAIWARLTNIPGLAGANEIGNGPVVHRTGIVIIQIFAPSNSGTLLITQTADNLRELFEFQDDGKLSYFSVSSTEVGDSNGWYQQNITIPYRAI
ncbi:phage tail terminator-like protein [Serratia fonticola]|uniref:phage tail terminator-like protein n=1 Tax=Serratia fonticola TaxID=47917 RepID=UPI003AAD0A40